MTFDERDLEIVKHLQLAAALAYEQARIEYRLREEGPKGAWLRQRFAAQLSRDARALMLIE